MKKLTTILGIFTLLISVAWINPELVTDNRINDNGSFYGYSDVYTKTGTEVGYVMDRGGVNVNKESGAALLLLLN